MDLQAVQVVFWLLLVAAVVMTYELKESLKPPVCRECPHCTARLDEERRRQAEAREAFARTINDDRERDQRR